MWQTDVRVVKIFYVKFLPDNQMIPSSSIEDNNNTSSIFVFLLTVNADHVFQDQNPLGQDLQGLSELLHGLSLINTIMFI